MGTAFAIPTMPELVGAVIRTRHAVTVALNRHVQVVVSNRQDSEFLGFPHTNHPLSFENFEPIAEHVVLAE